MFQEKAKPKCHLWIQDENGELRYADGGHISYTLSTSEEPPKEFVADEQNKSLWCKIKGWFKCKRR